MADHGATGKHSAGKTAADKSSQETKKIETNKATDAKAASKASSEPTQKMKPAGRPDETKAMPKVSESAGASRTVKPVTTGAAEAEAAQSKKRTGIIVAVIVIVLVIAGIIAFMAMNSNQGSTAPVDDLEVVDVEGQAVDNPINFAEWQAKNPDVYAYMNIPNTNVDLPILFNAENDNYYLTHDIDGNSTIVGAIYSQSMNKQDFKDPVTVLYGHTLLNGTMFSQLHNFEDPEFFEQNPYFNVYLPDEILTYEVVSAFEYDDRHIMNTFDFSDQAVVQEFFDSVQNPDTLNKHVREMDPLQAGTDNILVLSTCTVPSNDSARYLVVGKLVSTQVAKQVEPAAAEAAPTEATPEAPAE